MRTSPLTGWPLSPTAGYTLHAEEVKQTSFRLDGILLPAATAPHAPLVFLEAQSQPDDTFYLRWFTSLLIYKLPHLTREEIQAMLHWPEVDIRQTRVYQDALAEGREEGRQREVALVLRQLHRRFGTLTLAQETRIQALSVTELEALGEALLDFQTAADLTAWLQQPS
jgi:predicted transposase YdaD